jgi:hypothetical protein
MTAAAAAACGVVGGLRHVQLLMQHLRHSRGKIRRMEGCGNEQDVGITVTAPT